MSAANELERFSEDELWAELVRRGAALRVGYCYPAMCSDGEATALVEQFGYDCGPFQFIELGERLAEAPQWPMMAQVPEWARREVSA